MNGMPYNVSTILIITASVLPPENPATVPHITPITNATDVAKNPTINDILLPYIIRVSKSLPKVSVPSKWSEDGAEAPRARS